MSSATCHIPRVWGDQGVIVVQACGQKNKVWRFRRGWPRPGCDCVIALNDPKLEGVIDYKNDPLTSECPVQSRSMQASLVASRVCSRKPFQNKIMLWHQKGVTSTFYARHASGTPFRVWSTNLSCGRASQIGVSHPQPTLIKWFMFMKARGEKWQSVEWVKPKF